MSTHNMFLWRTDKNYPSVIIKYPPYLFHCCSQACTLQRGFKNGTPEPLRNMLCYNTVLDITLISVGP